MPLRLSSSRLALPAASSLPAARAAPEYPNGKITFIVGFAPGGGIDTYARVLAQGLDRAVRLFDRDREPAGRRLEHRGKGGRRAAPDGHTLLFTGNSYAINQTFYKNAGYANSDLRPVAFVAIDSQGLAVSAANPARTLDRVSRRRRSEAVHLRIWRLVRPHRGGIRVQGARPRATPPGVPFQSGAPALNALLGRHVDILAAPSPRFIRRYSRARCGCWRSPARAAPSRSRTRATLDELGLPGLGINGWVGILAPAKTPTEICAKLNAAVNQVVARPEVDKRLRQLGYEPYVGTLADAPAFLTRQIDTWGNLIRATGITAE